MKTNETNENTQLSAEKRVDVIIPCYNSEKTLPVTLNSLESQVFTDFYVILINDGSTDGTDQLICEFLKKTTLSAIYLAQENKGVSAARNLGLSLSKVEYVTFLDSDDAYHPCFLLEMVQALEKSDADVAFCRFTRNYMDIKDQLAVQSRKAIKKKVFDHMDLLERWMYRKAPYALFTYMFRQSIIRNGEINFNSSAKYGEDQEFTWKYLSVCAKGVEVCKELYWYYQNPSSVTSVVSWRRTDTIHAMIRVREWLRKNNDQFLIIFDRYCVQREIWSISKGFAQKNEKKLFYRFDREFNVGKHMKAMLKARDMRIAILALLYMINPRLFYLGVRIV